MTLSKYLAQVKERTEAATEGKWAYSNYTDADVWEMHNITLMNTAKRLGCSIDLNNAKFIAHARTDVPVLLEMVEYLLKETNYYDPRPEHIKLQLESLVPGNRKEKIHQAIKDMDRKKTRNTEEI